MFITTRTVRVCTALSWCEKAYLYVCGGGLSKIAVFMSVCVCLSHELMNRWGWDIFTSYGFGALLMSEVCLFRAWMSWGGQSDLLASNSSFKLPIAFQSYPVRCWLDSPTARN